MSYLVIKDLGHKFYLGKKGVNAIGKEFVVFKSDKPMGINIERYTYDEANHQLLWEGIQNLGQVIVGFADTEEEALNLAF